MFFENRFPAIIQIISMFEYGAYTTDEQALLLEGFSNHFHNILRLFDVLPNFSFPTTETMSDYYLWTWHIRVASRFAKRLKT